MNAKTSAFATVLRQFREAAGLSQELLAARAGLSPRGISDLERGVRTTPRLETVRMLADGLGLDDEGRAALLAARNASGAHALPAPRPSPLPRPSTTFFGREAEITSICDRLARRDARLVTLLGPGGVGKTRLAIEVGRRLANGFFEGVVFAGLASVKDQALVLPSIAAALGVPDTGSAPLIDRLAEAVRERDVLLLIDNFEQVIEAAPDIAALLDQCPTLSILATSRVVLNVTAETVFPVEPLGVPDETGATPVDVLAENDAAALFVDRARAGDPEFAITPNTISSIITLVRRLDGLPLAIELAAARLRIMPLDELVERMDRRLAMLTGGGRDLPERQQTMRHAISWSYDLLKPGEQAIFRRLSIFPAGCTLQAAENVLGASDGLSDMDILDGLATLMDSSLLRRRVLEGSPPRFVMLATIREFGLEKLAEQGEEEATREAAYRLWHLDLASMADMSVTPAGQIQWLELLEQEHDNLRSTLSWLIAQGRIQDALDLSGSLWYFRWLRGHYAEARDQFESLLRDPRAAAQTLPRAKALLGLGVVAMHQGDRPRSLEALRESTDILLDLDEQRLYTMSLLCYGTAYMMTGQFDQAEMLIRQAHERAVEIGNAALEGATLANLSILAGYRGDRDRALELLERKVRLAREIGETWGLSLGLLNQGVYALRDGNLDQAEELVNEGVRLILALKDKRDLPGGYRTLGEIARQRGDLDTASSFLEQGLQVAREIGDKMTIARCLSGIAEIALSLGDAEESLELAREAAGMYRDIGDEVSAVECLDIVVDIAVATGDFRRAAWCIGATDGFFEERGITKEDGFPEESARRVATLIDSLGECAWQEYWAAGYGQDVYTVLEAGFRLDPSGSSQDESGGLPSLPKR